MSAASNPHRELSATSITWLGIAGAVIALGIVGCSEPAVCSSAAAVTFDPPTIPDDGNSAAPLAQVSLHSSLLAGERVELEVDADDGAMIETRSAAVDADGNVTFDGVPVRAPRVTMHAIGRGVCGIGRADTSLAVKGAVAGNGGCVLALDPTPEDNAYYAALGIPGVLSGVSDPDPSTPGYQATMRVSTAPGWTAELFEAPVTDGGLGSTTTEPTSIGKVTADAGGAAARQVTVLDGELAFSAVCHGPAGQASSSDVTQVLADTTPPACTIVSPLPGTTITPGLGTTPPNPKMPISLPFTVRASDRDVAGEPVTIEATQGGNTTTARGRLPADGTFTTPALLFETGTYNVVLTMRDHAGNVCTSDVAYDVVTNGCEIRVKSPTAPVHVDADGNPANGQQVNVQVDVSRACAGRPVEGTCGLSAPSTFAGSDGIARMTVELCTAAPCHTQSLCTFHVRNPAGVLTQTAAMIDFETR